MEDQTTAKEGGRQIQKKWYRLKEKMPICRPFVGIKTTLHQRFCWIPQRMMIHLIIVRVNLTM